MSLAIFNACTGLYKLDLVGNPDCLFSHVKARIIITGIFKFLDEYYESLKREDDQSADKEDKSSSSPTPTPQQDHKHKTEKRWASLLIDWDAMQENWSLGFPTRSDTNRPVQSEMARSLKFWI